MDLTKFAQVQPFTLAGSGTVIGASTIILTTFTQIDGTLLTMTDFGVKGFGTLDPGNGTREEQFSFSGVTQNANGTATLTGVKTVLFVAPYTEAANLTKSHAGGSIMVISNTAGFYNELVGKDNDETISGVYTFTVPNYPQVDTPATLPTLSAQLATKQYVDGVAVAGAPNATTTVKGIVELATPAETAAGTATGGTAANLVPWNSTFNATQSATTLVPVTNASGKLDNNFLNGNVASGIATLDGSVKVVQNPANATATPTASKIPIADATSKLGDGWLGLTTAGDTVFSDGTDLQRLALGTANQVMKVNGGATAPTWVTAGQYSAGVATPFSQAAGSGNINYDETITTNFQPSLIILRYYIQGSVNGSGLNQEEGWAVYGGTTLKFHMALWLTATAGGDNAVPTTHVKTMDTSAPLVGNAAGQGMQLVLSINAVSATSFVIRKAITEGGSALGPARAQIVWEAWS